MFHTVVHSHKLGEMVNEYNLHNPIVLAIFVLKVIKVGGNLTSYDKNNLDCFL